MLVEWIDSCTNSDSVLSVSIDASGSSDDHSKRLRTAEKKVSVACRFSYLEICISGDCELLLRNFATRVGFALPGSRAGLHTPSPEDPPARRCEVVRQAAPCDSDAPFASTGKKYVVAYSGFVCAVALLSVDVNCEFDRAVCLLAN